MPPTKQLVTKTNLPKFFKNRPNDFLYDPEFTFSSERDYHKAAIDAFFQAAKTRVRPNFLSIFSDLVQYPSADLAIIKGSDGIPNFVERKWRPPHTQPAKSSKPIIETLFVTCPPASKGSHTTPVYITDTEKPQDEEKNEKELLPKMIKKATQTLYRESSAQTSPWQPPYKIMSVAKDGTLPEVLTLAYLSWDAGLPAGMHECKIIERARIRREWEKNLWPITDESGIEKLKHIITQIEQNEWIFREEEIAYIHELRMNLMLKLLDQTHAQLSERGLKKLQNYWLQKQNEKNGKLTKLKANVTRELRKLELKHKKISTKYHQANVVDEYVNYDSEFYIPLARHGEHPKRRHFSFPKQQYTPQLQGVEKLQCLPPYLHTFRNYDPDRLSRPKNQQRKLCIRETHWTTSNLAKLHNTLREYRLRSHERIRPLTLRVHKPHIIQKPATPTVQSTPDDVENDYQAALVLQKILQGRAVQSVIYEGRARNHELIEELKSTHALQEADMITKNVERIDILKSQRSRIIQINRTQKIEEVFKSLEGSTVGNMLDYLNKELLRLQDERRAHAMALMAMRERWIREAAEAGRRQKEERRRREHDEMFKQILKIHQDTVDMYLEDIIKEGIENSADKDAKLYIKELAEKIDVAVEEVVNNDYLSREEIAADLVYNFVIPEVDKQIVRDNLRKKQAKYLQAAHNTIYQEIPKLPKINYSEGEGGEGEEEENLFAEFGALLDKLIKERLEPPVARGGEGEVEGEQYSNESSLIEITADNFSEDSERTTDVDQLQDYGEGNFYE